MLLSALIQLVLPLLLSLRRPTPLRVARYAALLVTTS